MDLVVQRGPHIVLSLIDAENEDAALELADAMREIMGAWVAATPDAGRYAMRSFDLFARHTTGALHLAEELDAFAIWSGQRGRAEACALLLDFSDAIRAALSRIQDHHHEEGDPQ